MRYRAYLNCSIYGETELRVGHLMADSLADFKDGFWINADGRFTRGGDAKYWIPPSMIRVIAKVDA